MKQRSKDIGITFKTAVTAIIIVVGLLVVCGCGEGTPTLSEEKQDQYLGK